MSLTFGVILLQERPVRDIVEWAKRFDEAGADCLWVADHMALPQEPSSPWYAGWDLLAALAVATSRCHLGPLVTSFQLHSPLAMARHVTTVNALSNGRLEFGVGAGGAPIDRASEGVFDETVAELMARFETGLAATIALLRGEALTLPAIPALYGRPTDVDSITLSPDVLTHPLPPVVVGGQGPSTIEVAARHANRWNTYGAARGPNDVFESLRRNSQLLDERCEAYGRRPNDVGRSVLLDFNPQLSTVDRSSLSDLVERLYAMGFEEIIAYAWAGGHLERSPEDLLAFVAEDLPALRARLA